MDCPFDTAPLLGLFLILVSDNIDKGSGKHEFTILKPCLFFWLDFGVLLAVQNLLLFGKIVEQKFLHLLRILLLFSDLLRLVSSTHGKKNRGRGCVCGNDRDVAENGYNGEIMRIVADVVWFLEKESHKGFWTYNCFFVVELILLCNNIQLAIIVAIFEIL